MNRLKAVVLPLLRTGADPVYVRFVGKIEPCTINAWNAVKVQSKRKKVALAKVGRPFGSLDCMAPVVDLVQDTPMHLVLKQGLVDLLRHKYPDDSYVGQSVEIIHTKPAKKGGRQNYWVFEVEEP